MFDDATGYAWAFFGAAAWGVFYTRFYLQWMVSEAKGRSVVPPLFWYQSTMGSLMLLVWAWHVQSPLGALSHSVNLVPYSRNLIHIWRSRGRLPRWLDFFTHLFVILVVTSAAVVVVITWGRACREEEAAGWLWLAVGVVGQGLFAARVLVQWIATERQRRSVVPAAFWYISMAAAVMQFVTFAMRGGGEWLYAVGMAATTLIYARNLWFVHTGRTDEESGRARASG